MVAKKSTPPFLELLSESEGVAAGFQLTEKYHYAVYQNIKKTSDASHARRMQLFGEKNITQLQSKSEREQLLRILKNLISAKMITQIFGFEYKKIDGKNILKPCVFFLAKSDEETEEPEKVYEALLEASVKEIEGCLLSSPAIGFESLWKELTFDLKRKEESDTSPDTPDAKKTTRVDSTDSYLNHGLLNLGALLRPQNFLFVPSADLISTTIHQIEEILLKNASSVRLDGYGLLSTHQSSFLQRYEISETFFLEQVIPHYYHLPGLKDALTDIAQQEAIYYIDEALPHTTRFSCQKAQTLLEAIYEEAAKETENKVEKEIAKKNTQLVSPESSTKDLPGELQKPASKTKSVAGGLSIQTILALGELAEKEYKRLWQERLNTEVQKLLDPLLDPALPWQKQLWTISQTDFEKLPKAVRERVQAHPDLLFGDWQTKSASMILAFRKDRNLVKEFVNKMPALPEWEYWKILGVRQIIEKNDEFFRPLFEDRSFKNAYGRLLRLVYIKHVPLFYRFLLALGLGFFQDPAFQIAKKKIQMQQEERFLKNQELHFQEIRHQEWIRNRRIERIKNIAKVNHIKNKLDQFYFIRKRIPTLQDIQSSLSDLRVENFMDYIRENGFQLIRRKAMEARGNPILCYPVDSEWYRKKKRLEALLYFLTESEPDPELEQDEENFRRALTLQKYLANPRKAQSRRSSFQDPYLALETEIRKLKEREERSSFIPSQSDTSELQV